MTPNLLNRFTNLATFSSVFLLVLYSGKPQNNSISINLSDNTIFLCYLLNRLAKRTENLFPVLPFNIENYNVS